MTTQLIYFFEGEKDYWPFVDLKILKIVKPTEIISSDNGFSNSSNFRSKFYSAKKQQPLKKSSTNVSFVHTPELELHHRQSILDQGHFNTLLKLFSHRLILILSFLLQEGTSVAIGEKNESKSKCSFKPIFFSFSSMP